MRPRGFRAFALIVGLQLLISSGAVVATADRSLPAAGSNGSADANEECIGCGYTPDPPARGSVPRCLDVLCLVQGLLDRKSLIYIEQDIDISGTGPLPVVTCGVTIMGTCGGGSPCKIDARGSSQIFVVGLDGYLTLQDLEITGGACARGAAVTVSGAGSNDLERGGKFVALNVKFTNNVASELGAALNVESGGAVYIRDCVFRSNKAARGGAVFVGSSKDFPSNHTETEAVRNVCALNSCTTFINTEFSRNSADYGAAVYVDDAARECKDNGGAKFDCTTCVFRDNLAQQEGGALFINFQSAGGISFIRRSRFARNTAGTYGGDIATQQGEYGTRGAQLYAYQVVFSGSKASKGSAVAVKPFSISTFARCEFSHGSSLQCEGACDTFCPTMSPLSNNSVPYGRTGESCPVSPKPLCGWMPAECLESPTPSATPLPTPSPSPSLPSPPLLSPPLPSPGPLPTPAEAPGMAAGDPRYRAKRPFSPPPPPFHSSPPSTPPPSPLPSPPSPSPLPSLPPSPPPSSPLPAPPPSPLPSPPPTASATAPAYRHRVRGRHGHHRNGSITGDPHFVGKHGERFDFHGRSNRDYCVLSDKDFHINMHVFKGIHRRSTFISKIGVLFKLDKVLIDAQADKTASQFEEQWKVLVNNVELLEGHVMRTSGGLKIVHLVRSVQIHMLGELDLNVTVMPPGFGKFGSGANYLDFQINQLKVSPSVHGVLGQTYQESLRTYKKMHDVRDRRLKRSRAASLFVDGSESDYLSSSIMAADCKYSAYMDQNRISQRVQRMVLEGVQVLLGKREESVRQCTGFGHFLCLSEVEGEQE